jgi:glycosyltransferase involved in cell wall biosynthesis
VPRARSVEPAPDDRRGAANRPTLIVLHSSDELYGSDRVLLAVLDAIDELVEIVVVLPDDVERGLLSDELDGRGIPVIRSPLGVIRRRHLNPIGVAAVVIRAIRGGVRIWRLGRRRGAVAIHANTAAIVGSTAYARLLGARHVWHIHEIVDRPRVLARLIGWLTTSGSVRVVAISRAVAAALERSGGRVTDVLLNPAPDWAPRPAPPERPTVTIVGRVNGWKGHDVFLAAAKRIHEQDPAVRFRLVGGAVPGRPEPYDAIVQAVAELDPTGAWLEFSGWSSDVASVIEASTVVALPSTRPEPLNITALEAMAIGRPVIASAIGGLPEIVEDGVTGLLVAPGNAISLADAIERLLGDPDLAASLVAGATGRIAERFSGERYRASWRELYGEVLAGTDKPAGLRSGLVT